MQIAPFYDYERKNVFDWDPFDYLHWLRNIEDCEEFCGNEARRKITKFIGDGLFERIQRDMEKSILEKEAP